MNARQDADLLRRVASGDHAAFTKLMAEHEDRVFSVTFRVLGDREKALDATQETFLTVFRKAAQFKGDSQFGTWVYRIAVNTCYDMLRKEKRRRADSLPDYHDPADPGASDEVESAAIRPEIQRALAELPDEFRAAVVLADIEGLAMAEVAEALSVPVGTVKSRVFRGRRILAGLLGNQT